MRLGLFGKILIAFWLTLIALGATLMVIFEAGPYGDRPSVRYGPSLLAMLTTTVERDGASAADGQRRTLPVPLRDQIVITRIESQPALRESSRHSTRIAQAPDGRFYAIELKQGESGHLAAVPTITLWGAMAAGLVFSIGLAWYLSRPMGSAKLRGVNLDVNASGFNSTVEFYMNDAPITAGIVLQQMFDIGQIEVQRGPQGTLRGRASPSGSITVTTRKPDLYSFGGAVDMTANDIGTINTKAALNLPIIEGIAAIRLAGVWDENEADRVPPATEAAIHSRAPRRGGSAVLSNQRTG